MVVVYDDAFQSKIGYALLMRTVVIGIGGKAGHMITEVLCHFMTERQHLFRCTQLYSLTVDA